jgi:hypothetical protein
MMEQNGGVCFFVYHGENIAPKAMHICTGLAPWRGFAYRRFERSEGSQEASGFCFGLDIEYTAVDTLISSEYQDLCIFQAWTGER